AATNLMVDLPTRDSKAARDLLDDMRAVADKRKEAALWEQWAKAATNLMVDLRSRDSDAARDLLDDMRAVADERKEAALWKQWAKAATNLMVDLPTRATDAARDLYLELASGVASAGGTPACTIALAKSYALLLLALTEATTGPPPVPSAITAATPPEIAAAAAVFLYLDAGQPTEAHAVLQHFQTDHPDRLQTLFAILREAGVMSSAEPGGMEHGAPTVAPTELPDALVRQVFSDPQADALLRKVMADNGHDGAPADLPFGTQRAIVAILMTAGVIRLGGGEEAAGVP
ncbi:MAG: hypothetical protein AB7E70_03000, partial [Hyphomicrobiaceae bacterium]